MALKFTKMHSLGNDFVVIDAIEKYRSLTSSQAKSIADRHNGVGCDQILLVSASSECKDTFNFQIFNNDGSESAQCGNGARCLAKFLYDRRHVSQPRLSLRTSVDTLQCTINDSGDVTASLGVPEFHPDKIPFLADLQQDCYDLEVNQRTYKISALSIGNPHAVMLVADIDQAPIKQTGAAIEHHPRFPNRANVGYMQIESEKSIRLRVHERGVGETHACGSGATAAVLAGQRLGLLATEVIVRLANGILTVKWEGPGSQAFLTGPVSYAFEGSYTPS